MFEFIRDCLSKLYRKLHYYVIGVQQDIAAIRLITEVLKP